MNSETNVFVAFVPWSLTFNYGHFHVKEQLICFMLLITKEKIPKFYGTSLCYEGHTAPRHNI